MNGKSAGEDGDKDEDARVTKRGCRTERFHEEHGSGGQPEAGEESDGHVERQIGRCGFGRRVRRVYDSEVGGADAGGKGLAEHLLAFGGGLEGESEALAEAGIFGLELVVEIG